MTRSTNAGLDVSASRWPAPRALVVAALVLLASGATSFAGNMLIHLGFPNRPYPDDLLFRLVPTVYPAQYLTEPAIIGSLVLLFIFAVTHARDRFAEILAVFGLMYLARSVLMVLTPLANAYDGPGHYGSIPVDQLGMFPSGHIGAALLCYVIIGRDRAPRMKQAALGLMVVQGVALVLSRGHFSIDLVGGLLLAYFVYREWFGGRAFEPLKRLMGISSGQAG